MQSLLFCIPLEAQFHHGSQEWKKSQSGGPVPYVSTPDSSRLMLVVIFHRSFNNVPFPALLTYPLSLFGLIGKEQHKKEIKKVLDTML